MNQCTKQDGWLICGNPCNCSHKAPRNKGIKCKKEDEGKCLSYEAISKLLGRNGRKVGEAWINANARNIQYDMP